MKTTTYWAYFLLSMGALFAILLHLDKISTFWQILEGLWILVFIVLAAALYLVGTRHTSGGYLAMVLFGLNMLNVLVLFFLTGWLTLLIYGGLVNLIGFIIGVESLQRNVPKVEPYQDDELLPPLPPVKAETKKTARKPARKSRSRKRR